MERAFVGMLPWLAGGLAGSLPLLLVPPGRPLLVATAQLAAVVALGLAAAVALAPLADAPGWYASAPPLWRRLGAAATVVAIVTGMTGLVALASAAALRLDPSLQFLLVISALDVSWAVAAVVIGGRRGWGTPAAVVGGAALAAGCVAALWWYLDAVGFTPAGGWVVDGGELVRRVLPFDAAAAVAALVVLVAGTRRGQPMAQLSPQS